MYPSKSVLEVLTGVRALSIYRVVVHVCSGADLSTRVCIHVLQQVYGKDAILSLSADPARPPEMKKARPSSMCVDGSHCDDAQCHVHVNVCGHGSCRVRVLLAVIKSVSCIQSIDCGQCRPLSPRTRSSPCTPSPGEWSVRRTCTTSCSRVAGRRQRAARSCRWRRGRECN
jgi:hypothetical protein